MRWLHRRRSSLSISRGKSRHTYERVKLSRPTTGADHSRTLSHTESVHTPHNNGAYTVTASVVASLSARRENPACSRGRLEYSAMRYSHLQRGRLLTRCCSAAVIGTPCSSKGPRARLAACRVLARVAVLSRYARGSTTLPDLRLATAPRRRTITSFLQTTRHWHGLPPVVDPDAVLDAYGVRVAAGA